MTIVVSGGDCREDVAEFEEFRAEIYRMWSPQDGQEEFLTGRIVVYMWRERRMLRCERGEIGRRGSEVRAAWTRRLAEDVKVAIYFKDRMKLESSSRGIQYLVNELVHVLEDLAQGRLEVKARGSLNAYFTEELADAELSSIIKSGTAPSPEELARLRTSLEALRRDLSERIVPRQQMEAERLEAEIDRRALPALAAIDRLRRYSTPNARELNRAITVLERLQARRTARRPHSTYD